MDVKTERLLGMCHYDLIRLFTEVAKFRNFKINSDGAYRTKEQQFELYKIGRKEEAGQWVIDGKTVTNCDGYKIMSKHNYYPSKAVDVIPVPVDWYDKVYWEEFVGFVYGISNRLGIHVKNLGKQIGDWPHWEVIDAKK